EKHHQQLAEIPYNPQPPIPFPKFLAFQRPRALVRDEDCIQPRIERRIDIRLRAVADHPGPLDVELPQACQLQIGAAVFLFHDFAVREERTQSGEIDLAILLGWLSFREQRQFVRFRKEWQGLGNAVHELDFLLEDLVRERTDALEIVLLDSTLGEPQIALAEIAPEVHRPIAVNPVVLNFDLVEDVANLVRRKRRVIQILAEFLKRILEIDVVLPKRVIRVEDEMLASRIQNGTAAWGASRNGISTTTSTSTGSPRREAGVNSHFARASSALWFSRSSIPRRSSIVETRPSFPITHASCTLPSILSAAAAAMYFGSTLRCAIGGATGARPASRAVRSAYHISQLPE